MNNHPYCFYFPDSVNYKCKPCLPEVELHDFLGDFTNEVDEGGYITEFVSAGAKNNGVRNKEWQTVLQSERVYFKQSWTASLHPLHQRSYFERDHKPLR